MVTWKYTCCLVCKSFSSHEYVENVLSVLRRLVTHIQKSTSAQAHLKSLAMLQREDENLTATAIRLALPRTRKNK